MARLDNGRFVTITVPAGKHVIESSMKQDPLTVEVKPETPLYLEMVILSTMWHIGGRLIPVGEEQAKAALLKLKPLDAKWIIAPDILSKEPGETKDK